MRLGLAGAVTLVVLGLVVLVVALKPWRDDDLRLSRVRIVPISAELAGEPDPLGRLLSAPRRTRPAAPIAALDDYIALVAAGETDRDPLADRIEVSTLPPLTVAESGTATDGEAGFSFDAVIARAETLAHSPYRPLPDPPPAAAGLDYNEYRRIQLRREAVQWGDEPGVPYRVHYDPRGYLFPHRVSINLVENGAVSPHLYDAADFDFADLPIPENERAQLGFAGFRVTTPLNRPGKYDELVSFRGASFFRALSAGAFYGASARGLAIATGSPQGEEFPVFREFWLERPEGGAGPFVIHALMDSPSVSGAYRFTVSPGLDTQIEVEAVLVPRRRLENVGLAPITSMYHFSPHDMRRGVQDVRPAVHDSEGLAVRLANGEWAWRPLINPSRLEISSFASRPPLGFGLMQRSRGFADYQDLEAHYHLRPNVWITPGADWGAGQLTLVEIPTENEYNDNIVVFWRPEQAWPAGEPVRISYRMDWSLGEPVLPAVARVSGTRTGIAAGTDRQVFMIEFESGNPALFDGAEPQISTSQGRIVETHLVANPETGGLRLTFQIDPQGSDVAELRALLVRGGEAVSETWLYRWRQP